MNALSIMHMYILTWHMAIKILTDWVLDFFWNLKGHYTRPMFILKSGGHQTLILFLLTDWLTGCFIQCYSLLPNRFIVFQSLTTLNDWLQLYTVHFEYPPKWCTYSTVWLLHGWCHMKLLPCWHIFCIHHTTMHQFTVYPWICVHWNIYR